MTAEGHGPDVLFYTGTVVVAGAAVAGATMSKDTGPILAFVGAILVAVLTAYTSSRRQEKQLAHDRELKIADLMHARRMKDVEHLREFLDVAAEGFENFLDALVERQTLLIEYTDHANAAAATGEGPSSSDVEVQESMEESIYDAAVAAAAAGNTAAILLRRMDIRLEFEHPVREAYGEAIEFLDTASNALDGPALITIERRNEFLASTMSAMDSWIKFTSRAQVLIGAWFSDEEIADASIQFESDIRPGDVTLG